MGEGRHAVHSKSAGNGLTIFCWGEGLCCSSQKCWKWTDNILLGGRQACYSFQKCWKWTDNILLGEGAMLFIPKVLEMDIQYFIGEEGKAGMLFIPKVLEID